MYEHESLELLFKWAKAGAWENSTDIEKTINEINFAEKQLKDFINNNLPSAEEE